MDLSTLVANTTTVDIKHPVSAEPIGLSITLKPTSHPDVKAVQRRLINENLKRNGKGLSAEKLEANRTDTLVAAVESWRWAEGATFGGEALDFSAENVRKVIKLDWIRSQIDEALGDEAAFFQNSKAS